MTEGTPQLPLQQAVVALGGGHGLHASLAALRRVVDEVTAIVTVADNGGSSGRLRKEFGVLPPGDLRMALAALCGDDEWGQTWAKVLQHRFQGTGEMQGHVVGNLLIVALWELLGEKGQGQVDGLDWVGRLLDARGRVLPMALTPMDITAEVLGHDPAYPDVVQVVRGQVEVATTPGRILGIQLDPAEPEACPEALDAIRYADWVVLGPGSWYSSVIPHLRVPELRRTLVKSEAKVIVVLNLGEQKGETSGYAPEDHLGALLGHAPDLKVHTVLADHANVPDPELLESVVASAGGQLVLADVATAPGSAQHDPVRLADAYARIMSGVTGSDAWR